MKSLRVYYWYVRIPQCVYMEYGLKAIKLRALAHCETRLLIDHKIQFPIIQDSPVHESECPNITNGEY